MIAKKIGAILITAFIAVLVVFLNRWLLYPFLVLLMISLVFTLMFKTASKFVPALREGLGSKKVRFIVSVLLSTVIFYIAVGYANKYVLPGIFFTKSILGDIGILLLSFSLGWCLYKPDSKTISFTFFFSLALLGFLFINIESGEQGQDTSSVNIKTLAYLSYVKEERMGQKLGVTTYEKGLSNEGINVYNSWELPGAYLMDMNGDILHKWSLEGASSNWQFARLTGDCDLLLIVKDSMLASLDWNSRIKWTSEDRFHHEIVSDENGDIYTLTRKEEWKMFYGMPVPILNDYLTVLSEEGRIKKKISFFDLLKHKIPSKRMLEIIIKSGGPDQLTEITSRKLKGEIVVKNASIYDVFHTNTLEIIDRDINDVFRKGNIIFCSAMMNIIGVIDPKNEKVLWTWGPGVVDLPHHPTLLENGNLLIFDNGLERGYSRIIELDPSNGNIVWKYERNPVNSFYSPWGGTNQVLPNGNILVTESSEGRVFEITRDGKIMWDFYNPMRDSHGRRGTIYRMIRITDIENYKCLKKFKTVPIEP